MNTFEKKKLRYQVIRDKLKFLYNILTLFIFLFFLLNLSEMYWKKQIFKRKRNLLDKNMEKCIEKNCHSFNQFLLLRSHLGTVFGWIMSRFYIFK